MARPLTFKQLLFVKHYTSDDAITCGNATQSYKKAYQPTGCERTTQAMASKLLRQPKIAARLASAESKAHKEIEWNALRVLQESVRLYDRCMGDIEGYSFNAGASRAALELIGRNTGIGAFTETIEVSHTHYLEQALAKRSKVIEGRASVVAIEPAAKVQASDPVLAAQVQADPIPGPGPGKQERNSTGG